MDFKNNFKLLGASVVIIFLCMVVFNELRRNKIKNSIDKYKATTIGKTIGCNKNVKSSMYTLYYMFTYKNVSYSGDKDFNKDKRGDICYEHFFLVEFDTVNPQNNRIILDSLR